MSFYFEKDTSLDDTISHFDPDYCPEVTLEYECIYDFDWNVRSTRLISVWEKPTKDHQGSEPYPIPLERITTKDMKWIISVITKDAEDRAHDTRREFMEDDVDFRIDQIKEKELMNEE